jgi:hypothetical protein
MNTTKIKSYLLFFFFSCSLSLLASAQKTFNIQVFYYKKLLPNQPIWIIDQGIKKNIKTNVQGKCTYKSISNSLYIYTFYNKDKITFTASTTTSVVNTIEIYIYNNSHWIVNYNKKRFEFNKNDSLKNKSLTYNKKEKNVKTYYDREYTTKDSYIGYSTPTLSIETDDLPRLPTYTPGIIKSKISSSIPEKAIITTKAGLLTAGEVNDFSKWKLWKDIAENDLAIYNKIWGIKPENRYSVLVVNNNKKPVINAKVQLLSSANIIKWEAYTDNTGKAELWNNIYMHDSIKDKNLKIKITYNETVKYIHKVSEFHNGLNKIKLDVACEVPNKIDIAFIVDATGSMGDEIEYLKTELNDVIQKAKAALPHNSFRLGSVFYRDFGDEYVTRVSDLDANIQHTIQFIKNQRAGGGGDEPEGVDTALSTALNYMNWDKQAITRIAFLVLDAPPHHDEKTLNRIKMLTQKAAAMGIRLVPLTASGIGKTTEYLMRCMALATNGTYVFLTDDSGIGGSHIKPTTDKYNVELLNDLLVRLIKQYSYSVGCDELKQPIDSSIKDTFVVQNPAWKNPIDTAIIDTLNQNPNQNEEPKFKSWKIYPNPTEGPINIDIEGDLGELFLTDNSGKILQRIEVNNKQQIKLDIREYPQGIYYLKYIMQKGSLDAKVLLVGNK